MLGELKGTVDNKRRLSIPRKLRERLTASGQESQEIYLARGLDGCLWLLDQEQWKDVERILQELRGESFGFGSKQARSFIREFYRRTATCSIDGHGRITIPECLMGLAGIEKEVLFIAMPDRTEIWSAQRDPSCDEFEDTAEKLFG